MDRKCCLNNCSQGKQENLYVFSVSEPLLNLIIFTIMLKNGWYINIWNIQKGQIFWGEIRWYLLYSILQFFYYSQWLLKALPCSFVYCVLFIVDCSLSIAHCILYIIYCLLLIAYCWLHIVYCLLPIVYCLLSIVYCILYIVYCILYIVYCILYIVYCILYIVYCLL